MLEAQKAAEEEARRKAEEERKRIEEERRREEEELARIEEAKRLKKEKQKVIILKGELYQARFTNVLNRPKLNNWRRKANILPKLKRKPNDEHSFVTSKCWSLAL